MSDDFQEQELDFDGTNVELQTRLRWAANEAAFRRECERVNTPEMLTIRWIHGWRSTTDGDLRWWNGLPRYQRQNYIDFFEDTRRTYAHRREPLHCKLPDFWFLWNLHVTEIDRLCDEEDRYVEGWAAAIRQAYATHQPCPFDVSTADPSIRWRMEDRLAQAIRLAGVPAECLQPDSSDENARRKRHHRGPRGR